MTLARSLTLVWPGLPWLWLRGSMPGLVVAIAFALTLDVAVLTTWIWTDLVDGPVRIAVWTATGTIWLLATASAVSAFPPPIARPRDEITEPLFLQARDAYLARDWLAAESTLRALLDLAPTDGEAQLLLATLLRRVGRLDESQAALAQLSASDAGRAWQSTIARELDRIAADRRAARPGVLPLASRSDPDERPAAAA